MMRRVAQAWGFAAVLLLPNYIDLTSAEEGNARMRVAVPLTHIVAAQFVDFVVVAAVFAGLMFALRRLSVWPQLRWVLMAALPAMLFLRNRNVISQAFPQWLAWLLVAAWVAVFALLLWRVPRGMRRLSHVCGGLLAGFALFGLLMNAQMVRAIMWKPAPQAFAAPIARVSASRPRLIWVLFDELGYKQTFAERDASLQLPNLDRLRAVSTLYSDVAPIAYKTARVVPSLLLGRAVTEVAYTADNRFLVRRAGERGMQPFPADESVFGQMKRAGITSEVVGWYLPYCAMLRQVVTRCWWGDQDALDGGPMMLSQSVAQNAVSPLRVMAEQVVAPQSAWWDVTEQMEAGHIASVEEVSEHALDAVETSEADVIYLHLPAPHPPGFWDRRSGRFVVGGSYLDGLAYADRLLGQMLDQLERQPRWEATTVIVQGDHAWRTQMWRGAPGWSAEDERASHGGQWDSRPVLMVHAAGQNGAETDANRTSILRVHELVSGWVRAAAGR